MGTQNDLRAGLGSVIIECLKTELIGLIEVCKLPNDLPIACLPTYDFELVEVDTLGTIRLESLNIRNSKCLLRSSTIDFLGIAFVFLTDVVKRVAHVPSPSCLDFVGRIITSTFPQTP
ncbi:hypothetical protein KRX54_00080 [Actinomycetaceae bacterium TAE3-ERU4]|nr:hypothetical protein [Actinomycetaceae bacterium TAE3-ERU4]